MPTTPTRDDVFEIVRRNLIEVLPELSPEQITRTSSMRDLGANSLDRTDVVLASQEDLGIRVPARAFAEVSDIDSLVTTLHAHLG